jgi:proteasome assembly chaperone (PAC2) family protein
VSDHEPVKNPYLVAVWPGIGSVALTAGYYLMAKLQMHQLLELPGRDMFEIEHVDVSGGIVHSGRLPRSRFFVWQDPAGQHDVVLFIGEAQPPVGKYAFCHRVLDVAEQMGVERIFTFAAMASQLHPAVDSRVFGVATDAGSLDVLRQLEVDILEDGRIGGLNGVLLAAAAERGMKGIGLLGEMPIFAAQVPYPKASKVVLEAFATIARMDVNFDELDEQGRVMEQKLIQWLSRMEETQRQRAETTEGGFELPEHAQVDDDVGDLGDKDLERIDVLFALAKANRSKAFELKQLLDRLGVFDDYEDRFLDLFTK